MRDRNEGESGAWSRSAAATERPRRPAGLVLAAITAALAMGCVSKGVPLQKLYLGSSRSLYEAVLAALRDIGAEVVAQTPERDTATGHVSAETAGQDVLLEVTLDRRLTDQTYVQVRVWSELEELSREDQDLWRERFYDALDALVGSELERLRRPEDPGPGQRS